MTEVTKTTLISKRFDIFQKFEFLVVHKISGNRSGNFEVAAAIGSATIGH